MTAERCAEHRQQPATVRGMRTLLALAAISLSVPTLAQTATTQPPAPSRIPYPSVAAALEGLEANDGKGTIVTHADGWTIINEPMASAQWSFTPSGHHAFPAVVRRVIQREPGGAVKVDTVSLCEAPQIECSKLLSEFSAMNERITQAVQARGRQGPSRPPTQ